MKQRKGEAGCA